MLKMIMFAIVWVYMGEAYSQNAGYTISGYIKELPDGTSVYLVQNKDNGRPDTVDHVKSKNRKFVLKGKLPSEGTIRFVKLDNSISNKKHWVRLLLDNSGEKIKLTGTLGEWPNVSIEGSKLTKEYDKFVKCIKLVINDINTRIDAAEKDSAKIAEIKKDYDAKYLETLELIPGSYAVPLFLFNNKGMDLDLKEMAYESLSEKLKESYYGKALKKQIFNIKASKSIGIGKLIPDFVVTTPEGQEKSIRELAKQNKYTLIDFWASWCVPCRKEIPNLKMVYETFHTKGFNIIGLSTDDVEAKWKLAIKEDSTAWTQVIQKENVDKDVFGIISIPAYILLNDKAEILQMDMNSRFFSRSSVGTLNGTAVFIKDSKEKGLRGKELIEVLNGLF